MKAPIIIKKNTAKMDEKHKVMSSTLPKVPESPLFKLQTTNSSVGSNLLVPMQSNNIEEAVLEEKHENVNEETEGEYEAEGEIQD